MSIPKSYKVLDAAYRRLRVANERLREDWSEYCRLRTLGWTVRCREEDEEDDSPLLAWYSREGFGDQIPAESEWWKTHHDRLTHDSGHGRYLSPTLDEEVKYLEGSKSDFEEMQSNIRNRINELSRPFLRDLTIMDLPNELLLEIFNRFLSHHATLLRQSVRSMEFGNPNYQDTGELSEKEEEARVRLKKVHEEYMVRLKNQELMLASGELPRIVASAMARMPGARNLQFSDEYCNFTGHTLEHPTAEVWDALGIVLSGICIDLRATGIPGSLVLAPEIRTELSLSMQQVKVFKFLFHSWDPLEREEASDLNEFLFTCLDTSSLQHVKLTIQAGDKSSSAIEVGKVMGSRARDKLTRVSLNGPSVYLSKLIVFLDALPESMTHIRLTNVYLNSGTWSQVLDELRKKKYHDQKKIIIHSRGAEHNYRTDLSRIFGIDYMIEDRLTDADRYILRQKRHQRNPLHSIGS
ncbi:uncharacterized protein B0H64DRAFT_458342 [Chaetomium fimeti]|uniref:Uncharacterized protein n=1 Tax=Chaetomium fimeti TaxID=1854472 RepID=A0AAE0LUH0_9PEZI|nr:hypothetical protein B0H64DRAFT_458342 [Chaetomium fimeti]